MSKQRVEQLIENLQLLPHPEGGFYAETFRSTDQIPGTERNYLSSIYFLLVDDHVSHFHKIASDECWFFHEGSPLEVHIIHPEGKHETLNLGLDIQSGQQPFGVVPAGAIFGSHVKGLDGYTLVSCTVAPGFDFADFKLFSRSELMEVYPDHATIITRLTPND